MGARRYLVVLLCLVKFKTVQAITEETVVALEGDSTSFSCTESFWRYLPPNHTGHDALDKDVSFNGIVLPEFEQDFRMNKTNFIIPTVRTSMAGVFQCSGTNGVDVKSVQLIVLQHTPKCSLSTMDDEQPRSNFTGPNTCGLPQDQIVLSCDVTFFGNKNPDLEIRDSKGKVVEANCTGTVLNESAGHRNYKYEVKLKAELPLDKERFVCQTTQSAASQYSYTTETINLQYSFNGNRSDHKYVQPNEEVDCTAHCSDPQVYAWIWWKTTGKVTDQQRIDNTKIVPVTKEDGSYRCEATCRVANRLCEVKVKEVEVSSTASGLAQVEEATAEVNKVGLIVGCVLGGVAVAAAVVFLVILKRRNRRNDNQDQNQSVVNETQSGQPLLENDTSIACSVV